MVYLKNILMRSLVIILFLIIKRVSSQNVSETSQQVLKLYQNYKVLFGVASSAFQTEGAWNQSGKGENIWDRFCHEHPEKIKDRSNADIACDSYNNVERDIKMLKDLGVHFYRFSISWSRILPNGMSNQINVDGLKYYHLLIDNLKRNNIEPVVTMYHWDLPQILQDLGGWMNELIVDYFEDFARILFENFAKDVNVWVTFNEPNVICHEHYGSTTFPPNMSSSGLGEYLCLRNLFIAHARVYYLLKNNFSSSTSMIGLSATFNGVEPKTNSTIDIEAADKYRKIFYGLQVDPIYSKTGDYPEIFKDIVKNKSRQQGFRRPRYAAFTTAEIEYIRNTYDFLGISYYTTNEIEHVDEHFYPSPSYENDLQIKFNSKKSPAIRTVIDWLVDYPNGLRDSLNYIKEHYNNPKVLILENGCGTTENNVQPCVSYYERHIDALYRAITEDGCNVKGYAAWTLMDNFEWTLGYTAHFGLYSTNFTDPKRSTRPKLTAKFFQHILNTLKNDNKSDENQSRNKPNFSTANTNRTFVEFLVLPLLILWFCLT